MQLIPNNFFIPSKYIIFKNIINIKFKDMHELALKNVSIQNFLFLSPRVVNNKVSSNFLHGHPRPLFLLF